MDICEYYLENWQDLSNESPQWLQRMTASFSNFNKKLIYGNSYDFGDFDSCLSTRANHSSISGKYCLIKYHSDDAIPVPPTESVHNLKWMNLHESFGGAVCIPNVCKSDLVKTITDQIFNGTSLRLSDDYNQDDFCQDQKSISFNYVDYAIISLILLYILTIFSITWKHRNRSNDDGSYLASFSIISNLRSMLDVRKDSIQYLSLIRTILYIGLVSFHSYFLRSYYPASNSEKVMKFLESPFITFLSICPFGLLGFFVISSTLATKKILKAFDNKTFNYFFLLLERYARTMFVVAVVIILNVFINNLHIYQAPYYFPDQQSEACRKYWWSTMLLIQNYYHPGVKEMCAPQCWFLSANFHFLMLTPAVLYPVWKWRKSAFIIFPALIVVSQVIIFIYTSTNEDLLRRVNFFSITNDDFSSYYLQTHYLAPAWIIGMLVGVIYHKYKEFEMSFPMKCSISIFIAFMFFKLFAWNLLFNTPEFNFAMIPFDRLLVSLLAGSVMFMCNYATGGYGLRKITSSIPINLLWTLIDRVGLSLYLVHPAVIIGSVVIRKQPLPFDVVPIFINIFSDFFISLILAIILYLLVEQPFIKITKKLINGNYTKGKIHPQV